MGRNEVQKPTEAEIELLKVMWERGPCTVRDIHEALQTPERQTAYTTTLKLLQVMHAKGLVIRDESQRAHRFAALHFLLRLPRAHAAFHLNDPRTDEALEPFVFLLRFGKHACVLLCVCPSPRKAPAGEVSLFLLR